jgi:hypothetical protein
MAWAIALGATAGSLAACGDDPAPATDGGTEDTVGDALPDAPDLGGDTTADVAADAGQDLGPDSQTDAQGDAPGDANDEPDVGANDAAPDAPEVSVPDIRLGEVDQGTACDDHDDCEDPYACVDGVCTLDIALQSYVEQTYRVTQPEELVHVFDFVKSFASDVAFLALEVSDEGDPARRPVRYGSADRLRLPDTLETVYRWQSPERDRLLFTPARGESGLDGNSWESNVFQWNLNAHVVLPDLRVDTTFGFVAEQTQVFLTFSDDLQTAEGEFRGIVTRAEAEARIFGDTEFEPFRTFICRVTPDLLPLGDDWSLADVLDCNAAPLDVDLNGDGILDGYNALIEMLVAPAEILPAETD